MQYSDASIVYGSTITWVSVVRISGRVALIPAPFKRTSKSGKLLFRKRVDPVISSNQDGHILEQPSLLADIHKIFQFLLDHFQPFLNIPLSSSKVARFGYEP